MNNTYAGIGSRETPIDILDYMITIGKILGEKGYTLHSGGAEGADSSFEEGCDIAQAPKKIYLPYNGCFKRRTTEPGVYLSPIPEQAMQLAAQYHPAWNKCSDAGKKMHARNGHQVLGDDLKTPVDFVLCYTKNGMGGGGTGQAIRIAKAHGIDIYDFGKFYRHSFEKSRLEFLEFISKYISTQ